MFAFCRFTPLNVKLQKKAPRFLHPDAFYLYLMICLGYIFGFL